MKKMCTMENCKSNEGLCIHEKVMWAVVAIGIMAVVFFVFRITGKLATLG